MVTPDPVLLAPVFLDESRIIDIAVRCGFAPTRFFTAWNEAAAMDLPYLHWAELRPEHDVLDLSPRGMRLGLAAARLVSAQGSYTAREDNTRWHDFAVAASALALGADHRLQLVFGSPEAVEDGPPVDVILAWELAFRLDSRAMLDLLVRCYARLKPGGSILFQYGNSVFLEEGRSARLGRLVEGETPEITLQPFSWSQLRDLAHKLGGSFRNRGKMSDASIQVGLIGKPVET